ncbi:Starch-binding associating with outer membrane [Draconibacterium orientale]|uniref:Carbohydrate-binding protein SusD n=1 Tax=Draconibacterium orientale TaxID=1168034 RepID=X5DZE7_9BACT|nr:RagB/SusD family nutrient uptake outer membrane protein [Draconibacterium orientale]AHW60615.1 carbohydrate-binding protein SusD [Draconibacterium orientale]SET05383.1 Starch-binding associating with outer membrane [Draconibacterium orientale]
MKMIKNISILFLLALAIYSCEDDYLQVKNVDTGVAIEDLYSRYSQIQGVIWEAYSYLPDGLGELWLEGATDIAEATRESNAAQLYNLGTWTQFRNPDDVWATNFAGIDQVNRFLKNKDNVTLEEIKANSTDGDSTAYYKALDNMMLMEGEALFLKAFFYMELTQRYGGVPIFDEPLDYNDPSSWKNVQRNSVKECLDYIVELCDQANAIVTDDVHSRFSWYENGRITGSGIKALKAKATLYGASPLFKDAGSSITWEDAAEAAHAVIATGKFSLVSNYSDLFGSGNANSGEIIFKRRYGSINWFEYNQFPIAFVGSNGNSLTPTQNFVDAFEVTSDGTSEAFDWNNATHAVDPYANRDSRFYTTVVYNGSDFSSQNIETYTGGNSGLPKENATKTGYYLGKWVNKGIDLINATTANHTWAYSRYADILLMYAEAMYNAYGADADPEGYGMTALEAINLVRARSNVQALQASELNQAAIEHERMVELAFEGKRYWDVRRWKKATTYFNQPVTRIEITKNGDDFNYEVKTLENRVFSEKMNWYPIPQSEISKTGWEQNPSW